jgi:hypothetical protein
MMMMMMMDEKAQHVFFSIIFVHVAAAHDEQIDAMV